MGKENFLNHRQTDASRVVECSLMSDNTTYSEKPVFYWVNEDNIAISPIFSSSDGARKWFEIEQANDLISCRKFQYGNECLMLIEGEYFWYDDANGNFTSDEFKDYNSAIKWKLLNGVT